MIREAELEKKSNSKNQIAKRQCKIQKFFITQPPKNRQSYAAASEARRDKRLKTPDNRQRVADK